MQAAGINSQQQCLVHSGHTNLQVQSHGGIYSNHTERRSCTNMPKGFSSIRCKRTRHRRGGQGAECTAKETHRIPMDSKRAPMQAIGPVAGL